MTPYSDSGARVGQLRDTTAWRPPVCGGDTDVEVGDLVEVPRWRKKPSALVDGEQTHRREVVDGSRSSVTDAAECNPVTPAHCRGRSHPAGEAEWVTAFGRVAIVQFLGARPDPPGGKWSLIRQPASVIQLSHAQELPHERPPRPEEDCGQRRG